MFGCINRKMFFRRKTWQKIFCAVFAVFIVSVFFLFRQQAQADCCLCSSPRYHAPCMIDLETGNILELRIYEPHPTKSYELAEEQTDTETFSLLICSEACGYRNTGLRLVSMDVPICAETSRPALCSTCKTQFGNCRGSRYVIADLYNLDAPRLIPIADGTALEFRCYRISIEKNGDNYTVLVQGTRVS